jgi:hypothetical protein
MRTSAKVVLALSIVLLVLGTALVFLSVNSSFGTPKPEVYRYSAPGISYSLSYYCSTYPGHSRASALMESFGKLSFASGLAGLFIFTYLACHPVAKKAEEKIEENAAREAEKQAEGEAEKAAPSVIQLGDNTKRDNEQREE